MRRRSSITVVAALAVSELLALGFGSADAQSGRRLLLMSGNKLWTPLNIGSSLVAWWDAQNFPSIIFNSTTVSSWSDKASGIAATQVTGSAQPGYSTTARNGKPGLTFNGSQFLSFAQTGFPSGASPGSLALAAYATTNTVGVFGYGYNGSNLSWRMLRVSGSTIDAGLFTSDFFTTFGWSSVDRMIVWNQNGTAASVTADGVTQTATLSTPATGTAGGAIGANSNGGSPFTGVIQQAFCFNRVLTASEVAKLEGWESWYDGKNGSNLPANNPYKNRPPYVSDP